MTDKPCLYCAYGENFEPDMKQVENDQLRTELARIQELYVASETRADDFRAALLNIATLPEQFEYRAKGIAKEALGASQ